MAKGMVQVVASDVKVDQTVKFRYHGKMRMAVVKELRESNFLVQFPNGQFKAFRYDKVM